MPLLAAALKFLPLVTAGVKALPEFKALFDNIVDVIPNDADQATLKEALELAFDERDEAHAELQALVEQYGS